MMNRIFLPYFHLSAQHVVTSLLLLLSVHPSLTGVLRLNLMVSIRVAQTREALHFEVSCGLWHRLVWVTVLALVHLLRATELLLMIRRFCLAWSFLWLHFGQICLRILQLFTLVEVVFLASRSGVQKLSVVALLRITGLIIWDIRDVPVVQLDIVHFGFRQRVVGLASPQNAHELISRLFLFFLKFYLLSLLGAWVGGYYKSLIPLSDFHLIIEKLVADHDGVLLGIGPLWLLREIRLVHHVICRELRLIQHTYALFLRNQACHTFRVPSNRHVIDILVLFAVLIDPICHVDSRTRIFIFALGGLAPIVLFGLC